MTGAEENAWRRVVSRGGRARSRAVEEARFAAQAIYAVAFSLLTHPLAFCAPPPFCADDFDVFVTFVKNCRAHGINVPILPGIMPLNAYGGFKRMTGFCKTRIPPTMAADIEKLSGDDKKEAFVDFGIAYIVDLCQKLVKSKLVPGLHFYCLNAAEKSYAILDKLGYLKKPMVSSHAPRPPTATSPQMPPRPTMHLAPASHLACWASMHRP